MPAIMIGALALVCIVVLTIFVIILMYEMTELRQKVAELERNCSNNIVKTEKLDLDIRKINNHIKANRQPPQA